MTSWPDIPTDAIDWFRSVFREANRKVTELLVNVPNVRETSLDDHLIQALIQHTGPTLLQSGSIVRMDIHNIGGLARAYKWETADIAVLVFVQMGGRIVAQKIGLLQSKRLYPSNNDVSDEDPVGFEYGMNAFFDPQPQAMSVIHRQYEFTDSCVYGALTSQSTQQRHIDEFNKRFGVAIFYLLYNPASIPSATDYPIVEYKSIDEVPIGVRVTRANPIHKLLRSLPKGASPTFSGVSKSVTPRFGWPLERWVADLLLTCKVGQPIGENREELVARLLQRRTGPIAAAIAINIILPDNP